MGGLINKILKNKNKKERGALFLKLKHMKIKIWGGGGIPFTSFFLGSQKWDQLYVCYEKNWGSEGAGPDSPCLLNLNGY